MKVRKAIIPVIGPGTRFLLETKAQPNEILPIVDKPIVEEAIASGIEDILSLRFLLITYTINVFYMKGVYLYV